MDYTGQEQTRFQHANNLQKLRTSENDLKAVENGRSGGNRLNL
jgi:hypothetical protein